MSGWIRPRGIRVDAALFLHADGSSNPNANGYSFGYPSYPVNRKLANLISQEFDRIPEHPRHHSDNYTPDMRSYYGFSRVATNGPELLIEHGFLTNPLERAWLLAHIRQLAAAEYRALLRFFNVSDKPAWFEPWIRWKLSRPKDAPTKIPVWAIREYRRRKKGMK